MEIINYSAEPLNKVYGWLPYDLEAERVVFFPMLVRVNRHYQQEQLFLPNKSIGESLL